MDIESIIIGEVPRLQYVRITVTNDSVNPQCFYDAGGNLVEVKPGETKSFVVIRKVGEIAEATKEVGSEEKVNGSGQRLAKAKNSPRGGGSE